MKSGQMWSMISVTRFGEILPLWPTFKCFGLFMVVNFPNIWQNILSTLSNFVYYWANFLYYKWARVEQISLSSRPTIES